MIVLCVPLRLSGGSAIADAEDFASNVSIRGYAEKNSTLRYLTAGLLKRAAAMAMLCLTSESLKRKTTLP